MKKTFVYAFRMSLPVMAGYIVLGIGFGILMSSHGYAWWWSALISLCVYAGSMQYVMVDLMTGGASLISTALMTIMVNARHIFYSITMLEPYRDTGKKKPYLIFSLTDETFSLVCTKLWPEWVCPKQYYFFVSILNQCYWVLGSTIGAVLGNTFRFPSRGVDFSMTALFVVIVIDQWEKNENHLPAILGATISILCLALFGPGRFLIPAILIITLSLLVLRKRMTP